MKKNFVEMLVMAWCVALSLPLRGQRTVTLSGYVRETPGDEALPGATVYCPTLRLGVLTNAYGAYALSVPASADTLVVVFSFVGYQPLRWRGLLRRATTFNAELHAEPQTIRGVTVTADEAPGAAFHTLGTVSLSARQIAKTPALLGEKDALRLFQLLPGVQKGNEGSGALFVRGGGADQNLLVLDEATVYNAHHLFGFFSVFNPDALRRVHLFKSGIPAQFGGRLSSVVDMQMKEGSREGLHGTVGVGLLASRLTLEGPLGKGKSSFLVSGRRTYADVLYAPFANPNDRYGYFFHDFNAKFNVWIGTRDQFFLSGYGGKDRFSNRSRQGDATWNLGLDWQNTTTTARWNHRFSNRLFANTSAVFSRYTFRLDTRSEGSDSFRNLYEETLDYRANIRDLTLKSDLEFVPGSGLSLRAGYALTAHRFRPNAIVKADSRTNLGAVDTRSVTDATAVATYVEATAQLAQRWQVRAGLRLAHFAVETARYWQPEPRLALGYDHPAGWGLKLSYDRTAQFIHALSNTGVGLPTDFWVPSTARVAPQQARMLALGFFRKRPNSALRFTWEVYGKDFGNLLSMREGVSFLSAKPSGNRLNILYRADDWQDKITTGRGRAWGSEWMLQKTAGRLTGWVSYTIGWVQQQFDELNRGEWFYARHDRRHNLAAVGEYQLRPGLTVSTTWVYGSGQPIQLPQSTFQAAYHTPGQTLGTVTARPTDEYGTRDAVRTRASHRLDVAVQWSKAKRRGERTWELSVYNLYNQQNPYFYSYETSGSEQTTEKLYQFTVLPLLPSISYQFKF